MKAVQHQPEQKLQDIVVSILAACGSIKQSDLRVRPDVVLSEAWGRDQFAQQSTARRMRSDPMRDRLRICVGAHHIYGLVTSYSEGGPGVAHALINSNGLLEVFVREQRATDLLRAAVGATIDVDS